MLAAGMERMRRSFRNQRKRLSLAPGGGGGGEEQVAAAPPPPPPLPPPLYSARPTSPARLSLPDVNHQQADRSPPVAAVEAAKPAAAVPVEVEAPTSATRSPLRRSLRGLSSSLRAKRRHAEGASSGGGGGGGGGGLLGSFRRTRSRRRRDDGGSAADADDDTNPADLFDMLSRMQVGLKEVGRGGE